MGITDAEARMIAAAGPAKPLAEWTAAEYAAALDAAGVRERLAAEFEASHRERMSVVGRLLR